jgi:hypothetical protein
VPTVPNFDQVYYLAEGGSMNDLNDFLNTAPPALLARSFTFEFDPSWKNWGIQNVSSLIQTELHTRGIRSLAATSTVLPGVPEHVQLFEQDGFDVVYTYDTVNAIQARTQVDEDRGITPP